MQDLERHAEDQLQKAADQQAVIAAAVAAHDEHKGEHQLARAVADNIKALLGV